MSSNCSLLLAACCWEMHFHKEMLQIAGVRAMQPSRGRKSPCLQRRTGGPPCWAVVFLPQLFRSSISKDPKGNRNWHVTLLSLFAYSILYHSSVQHSANAVDPHPPIYLMFKLLSVCPFREKKHRRSVAQNMFFQV